MRGMKSVLTGILAASAVGWPSLGVAGEPLILHSDWSVSIGETLIVDQRETLILDQDWATPLSNQEMAEQRGGVRGMSFSVHFDGLVNGTSGEGVLHLIGPGGVINTDGVPDPGANPGAVDLQNYIGNMGPFQGLGQFAIVNGDGNDVSNSLVVNIFVTDDTGAMTTFADVLSSIDVTGP
jgi:hypothetical protein